MKTKEGATMPYILSPLITHASQGMWSEGAAYEQKKIYSIKGDKLPPVNYDEHLLRPHSLTHLETPAHTMSEGKTVESFYSDHLSYFYGQTLLLKLSGNNYQAKENGFFHWVISIDEIKERLNHLKIKSLPPKILISTAFYPQNEQGYHDPDYVLTLSQEAADFLISHSNFHLYGTSWKSSDFNPGLRDRPIHNTLFKKALILENLHLKDAPEGIYFMSSFPLPLVGASESPVVPVLFTKDEVLQFF
jgi:arylformamidase